MIKPDELYEVTVSPKTLKYFRELFPNVKLMSKIQVTGEQLSDSSHVKIKYICDFCGAVYERQKYSELRSGKEYNACPCCRTQKTILTCKERYGVNHPMQNFDIHKKSVEGHINNFGKAYNDCNFINGVPASQVQQKIGEQLEGFVLNYLEDGYYYDMFNKQLNLVIEYNGKGHDLQVRRGKITQEEFEKREQKRVAAIKKQHKLLIINDPYDRLIHPKRFNETFPLICQAVEQLQDYYIIQIK